MLCRGRNGTLLGGKVLIAVRMTIVVAVSQETEGGPKGKEQPRSQHNALSSSLTAHNSHVVSIGGQHRAGL